MSSSLKILEDSTRSAKEPASCGVSTSVIEPAPQKPLSPSKFKGKAAVVNLGCAKNQVDSEVLLGALQSYGYELQGELSEAEVIVVNTCSFLQSAVEESIDCILEMAEFKSSGRLRKLIVAGCLVERYKNELTESLPEVDLFLSINDYSKVTELLDSELKHELDAAARPYFLYDDSLPRTLSTPSYSAYVKISDGCNRPCSFCIIPKLRGEFRSRAEESVLREVHQLSEQGVKEINLIAQDLTAYGSDFKDTKTLAALLKLLDKESKVDWIRLLYTYPLGITKELVEVVSESKKVCNYIDLPLQHASLDVLKTMKRPLGRFSPREIVKLIKEVGPDIALRTTFIVGYPGESEDQIKELEDFVAEGWFENVGVFTYSTEEGTEAAELPGQLPQELKDERRERVMLRQQEVVKRRNKSRVGKKYRVLIEGSHQDTDLLLAARTEFQAPEVDGNIIINDISPELSPEVGKFGTVQITDALEYDLIANLISVED